MNEDDIWISIIVKTQGFLFHKNDDPNQFEKFLTSAPM